MRGGRRAIQLAGLPLRSTEELPTVMKNVEQLDQVAIRIAVDSVAECANDDEAFDALIRGYDIWTGR